MITCQIKGILLGKQQSLIKENNIHIGNNVSEQNFVKLRTERDNITCSELMIPSIQVNMGMEIFL